MKSIKENVTHEIIINKSRFICELIKINDVTHVKETINSIKEEYPDATHYCYAYIINEYKKSSDDGEPGGTAGVPIMEVLNKNNLNYVLCIVIRYFGGIKLGAGGLIRAYSKVTKEAIKENNICKLVKGYEITINTSYDKQKDLEYLLKNSTYKKEYNENITYTITCLKEILDILDKNNIKYKIIKEQEITI